MDSLWCEPGERRLGGLLQQAGVHCQNHQCEQAIALLEEGVRFQPHNPVLHYQLGFCYSGGCHNHSRVNAKIAHEHLRYALRLMDDWVNPLVRAKTLGALGNVYFSSSELPRQERLQSALDSYQQAAALYLQQGELDDWAREQYNLGNTWCELPEQEFPRKWEEAVAHYERALQVRTRERDAAHYAAALENLGTAYRELPTGDKEANVRKSIDCYRRALQVFTAATFPAQNAALHNNLANAYLSLPATEEESNRRNVQRALRHFDRALEVRTKQQYPCDYAVTQFNRGNAFVRLAPEETNPRFDLLEARTCFAEAKECFQLCGQDELADRAQTRLDEIQPFLRAA